MSTADEVARDLAALALTARARVHGVVVAAGAQLQADVQAPCQPPPLRATGTAQPDRGPRHPSRAHPSSRCMTIGWSPLSFNF